MKPIKIPAEVAVCPICKAALVLDEVTGITEQGDGIWIVDMFSANCETEPNIESRKWQPWHFWHWRTPYIDWLPVYGEIEKWLQKSFTVVDGPDG